MAEIEVQGKKIGELGALGTVTGTEKIPLETDSGNAYMTTAQVKEYSKQDLSGLATKTELAGVQSEVDAVELTVTQQGQDIEQNASDIASLQSEVGSMQAGFCLGRWDEGELDPEIVERKGETEFLEKWDAYLLDTTDNAGETTRPVGKLKRNNWLRFEDGRFAPTVGITETMRAQCDVELYLNAEHTEKYCDAGAFDAEKFYNEHGMGQKLYDATGAEIGHILRPWETVETKYTIGVGRDDKVYLVDQLKGRSGKVWRGLSRAGAARCGAACRRRPTPTTAWTRAHTGWSRRRCRPGRCARSVGRLGASSSCTRARRTARVAWGRRRTARCSTGRGLTRG